MTVEVTDRLAPSGWTVSQARGMVAQLRHVATGNTEYDALELFKALCDYLDQLYGGAGFDQLLHSEQRSAVAALIRRIHGDAPTGSATLDDNGVPVDRRTRCRPAL